VSVFDSEALVAHLCHEYELKNVSRESFSEAAFALCARGDAILATMALAIVEATVVEHFCEWWDGCDNGCEYRRNREMRPPWRDGYMTLSWPLAERGTMRKAARTGPVPVQTVKDARQVVTSSIRLKVFARDGHKCLSCGTKAPLEVDHIIPVAHGGSGQMDNLQTLCKPCNRAKRDKLPEQAGAA
jgi:5-methylcytosine-specific restriction endonuclease McrA